MSTRNKKQKSNRNKKAIFFLMTFCVIFFGLTKQMKELTEVFSSQSVTIDEDSSTPYNVPADATSVVEPGLDKDYLQLNSKKPNFQKKVIRTYGHIHNEAAYITFEKSELQMGIISSRENGTDHFTNQTPLTQTLALITTTEEGLGLGSYRNIPKNTPTSADGSSDDARDRGYLTNNNLMQINERNVVLYQGFAPGINDLDSRAFSFSNSLNSSDNKWQSLNRGSINPGQPVSTLVEVIGRKGTFVQAGWIAFWTNLNNTTLEVYPMDMSTFSYTGEKVELKAPSYNYPGGMPNISQFLPSMLIYDIGMTEDGGFIGRVQSSSATMLPKGTNDSLVKWNNRGEIIAVYDAPERNVIINVLLELSNDKEYYFYETLSTGTKLKKVKIDGVNTLKPETVKDYPAGTTLEIVPMEDDIYQSKYVLYGYSPSMTGEFIGYGENGGTILAYLDDAFDVINASVVATNGSVKFLDFKGSKYVDNEFVVGGETDATNFGLPVSPIPNKKGLSQYNAFWGRMQLIDDYPPALKFTESAITLNMDEDNLDWDKTLLTGIKVTDTFDLDPEKGGKNQEWLNGRINRNPLDTNLPIDWEALGLDKDDRGPQLIKYFITDSSMQTTAASRWLNKIDEETEENGKGAIAASNFAIDVKKIEKLTGVDAKKAAELVAWDLTSGDVKDDGTASKDVVQVNKKELETIQKVKKAYDNLAANESPAELIKPYPLTFTFNYGDTVLEKKITVFITDETTQADAENRVVLYGFDFKEVLKNAPNVTSEKAVSLAQASAWSYDMTWGDEPYPLAEITANVADPTNEEHPELTGLNNITSTGNYKVKLTYGKTTNDKVTAYISDYPASLHVRQVILDSGNPQIVVPEMGYAKLSNVNNTSDVASQGNISFLSSANNQKGEFTSSNLEMRFAYWRYVFEPVIPQYYEYAGFIATPIKTAHDKKDMKKTSPIVDFSKDDEYWVTVYIQATVTNAKLYNWDYDIQKFGK